MGILILGKTYEEIMQKEKKEKIQKIICVDYIDILSREEKPQEYINKYINILYTMDIEKLQEHENNPQKREESR
jgi:hypothetical protein